MRFRNRQRRPSPPPELGGSIHAVQALGTVAGATGDLDTAIVTRLMLQRPGAWDARHMARLQAHFFAPVNTAHKPHWNRFMATLPRVIGADATRDFRRATPEQPELAGSVAKAHCDWNFSQRRVERAPPHGQAAAEEPSTSGRPLSGYVLLWEQIQRDAERDELPWGGEQRQRERSPN